MSSQFLKVAPDGLYLCEHLLDPDGAGDTIEIRVTPEIHKQLLIHWHARKEGRVPSAKTAPAGSVDGFDRFWAAYPRKDVKAAAMKAWQTQNCVDHVEAIVRDVERRANTEAWQKERGKFIPMATTYLNQKRWMDNEDDQPAEEGWV